MSAQIVELPLAAVFANPDQPRQSFDPDALRELADSIAAQGLIQAIKVTPRGDRFMIVAGERRYRAHVLLGLETISATVEAMDDRAVMLQAIIENAVRRDVNIVEEATAYQRCIDLGLTVEEIAGQIGVSAFRVRWRLSLLNLRPEFQGLARSGQLSAEQALELAKLEPADQGELFRAINAGECGSSLALKARCAAIREASAQVDAFADLERPSEATRRLAQGFEARVRRMIAVLNEATVDNEVVAVKRIDPGRAATLADMFKAVRGDVERIESALRAVGQPALV